MPLSDEQDYALELFNEGRNLFISGPGGVGKSHLINEFISSAKRRGKKVQVCALTGCASLLLGCGAKTIHSWSGIKMAKGDRKQVVDNAMRARRPKSDWKKTNVLIIDEVSMMSLKIFEILEELARIARMNDRPFGGIQIVMTGDFLQLPPIGNSSEPDTTTFCFKSKLWQKVFPLDNHIILKTMFRQSDPIYIEILSQIRHGQISPDNIALLHRHSERKYDAADHGGICIPKLFPVRSRVDYIYAVEFSRLTTDVHAYTIDKIRDCRTYVDSGRTIESDIVKKCVNLPSTHKEFEMENLLSSAQCMMALELKIGAVVMCTANIDMENGICNGSQGIIIDVIGRENHPVVKFVNGVTMTMSKHEWQSSDYPMFTVRQYPLRLAWALTIHKIQGATLERAEIDVGGGIFEYGQTYVAMSRVKSLDGLYLSDFNPKKIRANPSVIKFYKQIPEIEFVDSDDKCVGE